MYNSLLLSTGGGIISNTQKSQQDDAPVLVIGVGGTGAKALDTLKKKVYKQLEADDPDSTVPEYNHIRFLEIDSDADWVEGTALNNNDEFLNLQDKDIRTKFTNPVNKADLLKKPQFQWLEADDIRIPENLNGAGGVRQLGRYMIINSSQDVYMKIKNNISAAVSGRVSGDLVVHIIAGISGGMGSGCFLDVCYIVRKVLEDLAIGGAVVFGYVFLPDVITTIPEIASSSIKVTANYRNGYAALTELDYLMNLKANHCRFKQNYGAFTVDTDMAPVDMCHLVSSLDANGNSKANGYKYCMNVTADYIMSYLSKTNDTGAISPKGHLANVNMGVDLLPVTKGAYNRYHVLGASNAELPMSQVATYLATCLYDKMSAYMKRMPVDSEVVEFAEKQINLKLDELKRMLSKDVRLAREVPAPEMSTVKNITASYVHAESILKPMNDWLSQQEGVVTRNFNGLNSDISAYAVDSNATSLIGVLYNKLVDLALDPNFGPYYAIGMLRRTGKDISAVLQGLHMEADKLCKDAAHQEEFQARQVEEAKQEFTRSKNTLFNGKVESNAYDNYRGAIGIWYRRKLDTIMYSYVDKAIQGLMKKADDLYKEYFGQLKVFLDELDQTFVENKNYFDGGHGDDPSGDGFTIRIMKFSEIKPHLDSILLNERPEDAITKMIKYFFDNSEEWRSGEEYRITRMVNRFMAERFSDEMNKGMQDYLKEKYPGKNAKEREQALQNDLFMPLMKASEPLFWCSATVSTNQTFPSINLSYPESVSDIKAAAADFKKVYAQTELRGCEIGDRAFMLRLYSGMPLYGYHGLNLMKKEYDECRKAGLHLFGKGEENWRDLATPIPYSLDSAAVKNGENIEAAFKKAMEIGVIKISQSANDKGENTDVCILKKPKLDDKVVIELLKDLRCIGEYQVSLGTALDANLIKEVKENYFSIDGRVSNALFVDWEKRLNKLKNDICMGEYVEYKVDYHNSADIALDNIIHSPVMTKILLETIDIYNGVELALERMSSIETGEVGETQNINDFCNALFTGVLKQSIGKISFKYEERHMEKEAVLASKAMPYGRYLFYQAYVSFKELDDSIKAEAVDLANEKINNLQEGDDAIALKILQKCTPKDMSELERQYRQERDAENIGIFYEKFLDSIYAFTDQFR